MASFRSLLQSRGEKKTCVSKRTFLVAVIENIWTLEGMTVGWRKWHNTDLSLHCLPDIMVIRARTMRWGGGRVARMAVVRNVWNFLFTWLIQLCYIAHYIVIYPNPHNSSNRGSRITRHLGYKHAFSQNVVSTQKENCFSVYFLKIITFLNVGLLRICQVLSFSCRIVCWWVTTICCFIGGITRQAFYRTYNVILRRVIVTIFAVGLQ